MNVITGVSCGGLILSDVEMLVDGWMGIGELIAQETWLSLVRQMT